MLACSCLKQIFRLFNIKTAAPGLAIKLLCLYAEGVFLSIDLAKEAVYANSEGKGRKLVTQLHRAEAKLIEIIRSIGFGEIEGLRIRDRLPVGYRAAKKTCKF